MSDTIKCIKVDIYPKRLETEDYFKTITLYGYREWLKGGTLIFVLFFLLKNQEEVVLDLLYDNPISCSYTSSEKWWQKW